MADGGKIEVKKIDDSALSADEIAKAIEQTAQSSAAKKPATIDDVVQEDSKKTVAKKAASAAKPTESETGTKIIVKRKDAYVQPPGAAEQLKEPVEGGIQADPPALRAPSQTQKIVAVPEEVKTNGQKPEPDGAEPPKAEGTTDSTGAESPVSQKSDASTVSSTPAVPRRDTAGPLKPAVVVGAKSEEPALQNPVVFDTTQYHLPIKPDSRRYVNSAVAWVVLLLTLAAGTAYVLVELEIVSLSDLKLL